MPKRIRTFSSACVATLALVSLPGVAAAGLFGGFGADGSYRQGESSLCKAVKSKRGLPTCNKKSGEELSKLRLDRGEKQVGSGALVSASKSGSKITISDQEGGTLFVWDSGQVIAELGSVYLDPSGFYVAVEYGERFGGRSVEALIVVELPSSVRGIAAKSVGAPTSAPPSDKPKAPTAVEPGDAPEIQKLLATGIKWSKRRKHPKALEAWNKILAQSPEHPEALYRRAKTHVAQKNKGACLKDLEALKTSVDSRNIRWKVEARFDKAFASLRGDTRFRKAVGIEREPGEKISAYERLIAFGGKWEQEVIPCEQAQVNLELQRNSKRRFDLVIRSKCQGYRETTRLDGSWRAIGDDRLHMTFPNLGADDEGLSCQIEQCTDGSGEDCLRCSPEPDLEFLLRVVRR